MLRSDLIFLQQRLLVRNDVESFLTEAFGRDGAVRVVLHGLPGIGYFALITVSETLQSLIGHCRKSTMARYFAYKNRGDVASLWIPASSNSEIIKSFEEYAKQICGENRDYSEPVSFVGQKLSKQCPGQWLVVFDGLDDPSISIERYLSALPASKLLFTTRHKDLASQIPGAYVLHVTPLDENTAEDLLNTYITSTPVSATTNKASQKELPVEEKGAKRRIVKELGGLPLAISIVGASMREDNGIPSMNCQAYLTWSDEAKDVLLDQDRQFSDYSSSVWKAFTFAFQKILSGTGGYQYTASMAYFTASCENASNLADYFRLYRKIKNKNPGRNRPLHSLRLAATDQIRFLENGLFELAIAELAAVNMITLNWTGGGPNSLPYIEMHSLVKRWLERSNYGQILTYTAPKMWLLGFGMYDQMVQNQVGLKEFEPLMKEIKASLDNGLDTLHKSCIPMLEIVFPFLLEAQKNLSRSIDHLPAGSDQRRHLRQFSKVLKSEIADSYDYNLEDIDWHSVFQDFVQEFEEQVECAVKSDAKSQEYMLKDFFLETLDSHGCIPIAFTSAAPYELSNVGQTSSIGDMGAEITAETESLLEKCLSQDSIKQAAEITHEGSHAAIRQWTERWDDDIKDIIGRCLSEVLIKRHCVTDSKGLVIDTSLPTNTAAEESSIGDVFRFITSSDSSNAFFAILRRAVKTATGQFLTSSPAIDVLNTQRDTFRDACESALRRGLGDRAQQFFWFQSLSSEAEDDTGFSLLWQLAWPARFPGGLEDLIAEQVVNSISNDLKKAAKTGFITAFEPHCQHWLSHGALNLAEDLAESVFEASGISNLFLNWIASGWVDLSDKEDDDSDDGVEPIYTQLIGEAQRYALDAMKAIYDNQAGAVTHDSVLQSLKRTFECRKELHDTVMGRLTQPNLTDQSGLGPFFAKMYFEDCDKNLRLAYSVLGNKVSTDDVATLDRLAGIETGWTFKKER